MGVASMVLGIVSLLVSFIPFCGFWAVLPAIVGIALGLAELIVRWKQVGGKGMAIAGLVLNPLAILVIVSWWLVAAMATHQAVQALDVTIQQQLMQDFPQSGQQGQQSPDASQPVTIPPPPLPPGHQPPAPPMQPMQPVDPDSTSPPSHQPPTPVPPH